MADKTLSERLQPSLLDRLTDNAPDKKTESREERVIDIRRLREIIRRDLGWLLNTTNLDDMHDMEAHPNVARSVLNYGIPDVAGSVATSHRAHELQDIIRTAIEVFEPRILPGSLEVVPRLETHSKDGATIAFDIRGDLWAQPLPLELYLRSQIDVTTGELRLEGGN
jgi:type VI secretion system protein ImpF